MYTVLDVVSAQERRAELVAFEDRQRFTKFMEAAERYAEENGLIVGGASANRLLLGDPTESGTPAPVDFNSFRYEFYSAHAVQHARGLADVLYAVDPEVLGRYTTMRTKIPDTSFSVEVDGRDMFQLTALKIRRGTRMADVMIPSQRPAQFAKESDGKALTLQCSGPENQLIEVYTALCNPAKASSWKGLLDVEAGLRSIFNSEIKEKLAEATSKRGGSEPVTSEKLVRALRAHYASGPSRVVVGCAAACLITGGEYRVGAANHLQVVTVAPLEADAEEIVAIAGRAGCEVQWSIGDPNIPIDPRLRRMSVHLVREGAATRRELVLEVYNAAAHELTPYTTAAMLQPTNKTGGAKPHHYRTQNLAWHPSELPPDLKIGTPFAVMRFRLADMWTIQMLLKMGVIDAGYAKGALNGILADYIGVASAYDELLQSATPETLVARCLPLDCYIGRFDDPEIAQKRAAQLGAGGKFYQPYMPLLKPPTSGLKSSMTKLGLESNSGLSDKDEDAEYDS